MEYPERSNIRKYLSIEINKNEQFQFWQNSLAGGIIVHIQKQKRLETVINLWIMVESPQFKERSALEKVEDYVDFVPRMNSAQLIFKMQMIISRVWT